MAGTQPSQSDDSNVHFGDMPVLTNGKSRYLNAVIEPFSLRQGIKGKSASPASVVKALFCHVRVISLRLYHSYLT